MGHILMKFIVKNVFLGRHSDFFRKRFVKWYDEIGGE
jgi:hypothetical protein